jgi:hypothetical protein
LHFKGIFEKNNILFIGVFGGVSGVQIEAGCGMAAKEAAILMTVRDYETMD